MQQHDDVDDAGLRNPSQLAALTRLNWRTVVRRLADVKPVKTIGKSRMYDPARALPVLYAGQAAAREVRPGDLDPKTERTRRDKEAADKLALENQRTRGELVSREELMRYFAQVIGEAKTALLGIGSRVAPRVVGRTRAEAKEIIDRAIHDALSAVAERGDT